MLGLPLPVFIFVRFSIISSLPSSTNVLFEWPLRQSTANSICVENILEIACLNFLWLTLVAQSFSWVMVIESSKASISWFSCSTLASLDKSYPKLRSTTSRSMTGDYIGYMKHFINFGSCSLLELWFQSRSKQQKANAFVFQIHLKGYELLGIKIV